MFSVLRIKSAQNPVKNLALGANNRCAHWHGNCSPSKRYEMDGFTMTNEIDNYVGKRLRRRRRLLGLTQQNLGEVVGIRFQQIQKYECGANRVSAARLFELAEALGVPVQYFYEGLSERDMFSDNPFPEFMSPDVLSKKETMDLVRAYYSMGAEPRKHLLDLAKSLEVASKATLHLVAQ